MTTETKNNNNNPQLLTKFTYVFLNNKTGISILGFEP
jgi:hypothetical protein